MPQPAVKLRPATEDDCERLWRWRNDPGTRRASFHTGEVPLADHLSWFEGILRNRDRLIFIAERDGEPAGQVRFDRYADRTKPVEISITIAPECRGRGLGRAAIEAGVHRIRMLWAPAQVLARIKSGNTPSVSAFTAAGFRHDSEDAGVIRMLRDTAPPGAAEIERFKADAWTGDATAEAYERRIHKRSGIVRVKNLVEIGYALQYAAGRVLDAGAGTGRFSVPLLKAGCEVVALDISPAMLRIAQRNSGGALPGVVGDLLALPFADAAFDSVVSITVVEHLPHYREAFAEFVRVLKPGGTMIVQLCSLEHTERAGTDTSATAIDYTAELDAHGVRQLLAGVGAEPVRIAPYDLLNENLLLQRRLGRAWKPIRKLLDRLLRLPLAARAFAWLEGRICARLPLWISRPVMIVARKPER